MKRIFNIYKKSVLVVAILFGSLMTSCTDYLTIIPPEKIVHEKFWQTEDEVNGMLATTYIKLISGDAISRAIVWGELRADNMTFPANPNKDIKYIVESNILDENGYTNWAIFYEAINYANLVIEYAPQVVERDPDFTEGDLNVVLGEMHAMRALCHFYLVRAFRDIPLAIVPAANDAELPDYPQAHPLEAMKQILADIDYAAAPGMIMESGSFTNRNSNFGRITRNAVLALKADVCLWLAAFAEYYENDPEAIKEGLVQNGDVQNYYNMCIESCDKVIENMHQNWLKENEGRTDLEQEMINNPYHLLMNEGKVEDIKKSKQSTVYNAIFGAKNSKESIFELQITDANARDDKYCWGIRTLYGAADNEAGQVIVPKNFLTMYQDDDLRKYSFTNFGADTKDDISVSKYVAKDSPSTSLRKKNEYDANWIIYRKTDVLLMKAEALAAQPSATSDDFKAAFELAKVVNVRSRIDTISTNIKVPLSEPGDRKSCLKLVLDERARELTYEGKRWFDLVRKALRDKNTMDILFVADKLTANKDLLKSKMSTIDGLFFPINIDEMRFNKNLEQNPAYLDKDSSVEMN